MKLGKFPLCLCCALEVLVSVAVCVAEPTKHHWDLPIIDPPGASRPHSVSDPVRGRNNNDNGHGKQQQNNATAQHGPAQYSTAQHSTTIIMTNDPYAQYLVRRTTTDDRRDRVPHSPTPRAPKATHRPGRGSPRVTVEVRWSPPWVPPGPAAWRAALRTRLLGSRRC